MNQDLINMVTKALQEAVGADRKVDIHLVQKNNGLTLHGIVISRGEDRVYPTLYLEDYLDESVSSIVKKILLDYEKAECIGLERLGTENLKCLQSFEEAKDKLSIRLINYDLNADMLKDHPHKRFLDLAVICCMEVVEGAFAKLNNQVLKKWNVSEEELFKVAKENTMKTYEVSGRNMVDVLSNFGVHRKGLDEFRKTKSFEAGLYVLTYAEGMYGATAILYDDVLKIIAERAGGDLVIIPSSVHEVLLMSMEFAPDKESLREMVSDVNAQEVAIQDFLSNNVYVYRRETDTIEMM